MLIFHMLHTLRVVTTVFTVHFGRLVVHTGAAGAEGPAEPTMTETSAELAALVATHILPPEKSVAKTIALLRRHAVPAIAPRTVPPVVVSMMVGSEPTKQQAAQHQQTGCLPEG
jgi:hypothetical protein